MASPHLQVISASAEQSPIVANLLELYAHDFSEFRNLEIGEDGRFGYPSLPFYWSERHRHPFLFKIHGKLAGLALVQRGSQVSDDNAVWDMAEFFILRGCRRLGIGTQLAHEVWRLFPGKWEVRVMHANVPAQRFWVGAISMFMGEAIEPIHIEKGGQGWSLFSFESKPAA